MEIPILFKSKSSDEEQLKHLGFLWSATLLSLACMSKLYEYMKQHAGSLRPTVVSLEGRLVALLAPVYKEHKLLYNILLFADDQVDKVSIMIEKHGPNLVKKIVSIVHWGLETTEEICDETRLRGISGLAISLGIKFALFAMTQSVKLLVKLGHFTAMPMLPGMSLPSADTVTGFVEGAIGIGSELAENVIDIAKKG